MVEENMPANNREDTREPAKMATRLQELATLPVFYKLAGKRVIVVGGSNGAAWKAELLAATQANVDVIAPEFVERLVTLRQDCGRVRLIKRQWAADDFSEAVLAIAETEDPSEAEALRRAAKAVSCQLNIIDKPAWSDFQFGAIVERSPLVIGISTDGAAPVFGQAIRSRMETLLPDAIRRWASAAKTWRTRVSALQLDFRARRAVWERFTRLAMAEPGRAPTDADFETIIGNTPSAATANVGEVLLVGAGPGDPELLTLRALRALQSADVVLFDDLVSPQVLELARREADRISVGKRGFKPSCTQEDICALMIGLAQQGKTIVRLKGGDPMVFGRASEEIDALADAGIKVSVVPGVTAASAAAASLNLSLTERTLARRLQFVTAHARGGTLPDDLNWFALADPLAATVVYMGVRTLPQYCARLIAEGLPGETPAVLVERASQPDQRQISGTVATLPGLVAEAGIKGPALTIIGQMVRER
jgi:uroporphyrin-III C-methyltransferase/precorrin-2 dehydrogenase/sirohydrochlorin ferrochelatase